MKQKKGKIIWLISNFQKILKTKQLVVWVQVSNEGLVRMLKSNLKENSLDSVMVNLSILNFVEELKRYKNSKGGCSVLIYSNEITIEKLQYIMELEEKGQVLVIWWQIGVNSFIEGEQVLYYYKNGLQFEQEKQKIMSLSIYYIYMLMAYKGLITTTLGSLKKIKE